QVNLLLALLGQIGGGLLRTVGQLRTGLQDLIQIDIHSQTPLSFMVRRVQRAGNALLVVSLYSKALRHATAQPKNSRSMEFSGTRSRLSGSTSEKQPASAFSRSALG